MTFLLKYFMTSWSQERRLLHELRQRLLNKGTLLEGFVEKFVKNFVDTYEENFVEDLHRGQICNIESHDDQGTILKKIGK